MNDLLGNLTGFANFLERKWFEKSGLFTAVVVGSVTGINLFTSEKDAVWVRGLVLVAIALLICFIWLYTRRVPKAEAGRIGVVVAISSESDEESQRLRADFIAPFRRAINDGLSGDGFQFIELPNFLTAQVIDNASALEVRKKCRAHLLLYGRVRRRVDGGETFSLMELDGVVAHRPIAQEISHALGKEFSEILPRGVKIPAGREFAGFSFTSNWAEIVSKYVLGIAAGLSGDLSYAESMFLEVRSKLKKSQSRGIPVYTLLTQRIPIRLAEVYEAKANIAYAKWREGNVQEGIDELGVQISAMSDAGVARFPNYYFLSAIHIFLRDRNVQAALDLLKNVRDAGGIWNLNVAFLNAYKGNLKSATRHYKNPASKKVELDVVLQVEDFICRILEAEPQRYQLHFCLGVFNEYIKGDNLRAIKDFEIFLSFGAASEFPAERELARISIDRLSDKSKDFTPV